MQESNTSSQNSIKLSSFATKSVSQFTSKITAKFSEESILEIMRPSAAVLEDFFSALRALFFLKLVIANSISPFDSTRAFLHSIIPKPVFSLNNLTSLALIVITNLNKLTILKFYFRLCSLYFLLEYLKTQEDSYLVLFQHS